MPAGFGFSDTALRVFILMAARRLKSDRFFTVDDTPEGIDLRSLILRHDPELAPLLTRSTNAFQPWTPAG